MINKNTTSYEEIVTHTDRQTSTMTDRKTQLDESGDNMILIVREERKRE